MSDEIKKAGPSWPADEVPPDQEEQAEAARLVGELDNLLEGKTPRGAEQALAAAVMVRAAQGAEPGLSAQVRGQILDAAMSQASPAAAPRQRRLSRAAPIFALAATLTLVITVMALSPVFKAHRETRPAPPRELLSRPSDALMGKPFTDRAGASARLDRVFADRLHGYRTLALAGGGIQ